MARKRPLLSVCMIIKNEEALLPGCLKSVEGLADEVVIVDTGSTDRSVEIARRAGAAVLHEPWANDFSAPLNKALRAAKGQWILRLDGDEELYAEHREKLRQLLADESVEGYIFPIVNLINDRSVVEEEASSFIRLFRNRPEYKFEGAIHEQIVPSIVRSRPNALFKQENVRIRHYGYLKEICESKKKPERNMEILRQAVMKEPDNAFIQFNLGIEYRRLQQSADAARHFALAMSHMDPKAGYAPRCVQAYAMTLIELRRLKEAKEVLEKGQGWYPDYTDLFYLLGVIHFELNENEEAVAAFIRCVEMGDSPAYKYVVLNGIGGYKAHFALGQLYHRMGRLKEALEHYENSYTLFPRVLQPLYSIVEILLNYQTIPVLQSYLEQVMPFGPSEKFPVIADIFLSHRQYGAAEKYCEAMVETDDASHQFRTLLAGCYRKRGDYAGAIRLLLDVPQTSPSFEEAMLGLGASYWYRGERDKTMAIVRRLGSEEAVCAKLARMFLEDSKDIVLEGIRLHPDAQTLREQLGRIEEAIRNVGS